MNKSLWLVIIKNIFVVGSCQELLVWALFFKNKSAHIHSYDLHVAGRWFFKLENNYFFCIELTKWKGAYHSNNVIEKWLGCKMHTVGTIFSLKVADKSFWKTFSHAHHFYPPFLEWPRSRRDKIRSTWGSVARHSHPHKRGPRVKSWPRHVPPTGEIRVLFVIGHNFTTSRTGFEEAVVKEQAKNNDMLLGKIKESELKRRQLKWKRFWLTTKSSHFVYFLFNNNRTVQTQSTSNCF